MKTFSVSLYLIGIVAFVEAASSPEFRSKVKPLAESCKEKVKGNDKDVDDVINLRAADLSAEGKCLVACVDEALGFIKNGDFGTFDENVKVYQQLFAGEPEKLAHTDEVVKRCIENGRKVIKSDVCEGAYIALACFLEVV